MWNDRHKDPDVPLEQQQHVKENILYIYIYINVYFYFLSEITETEYLDRTNAAADTQAAQAIIPAGGERHQRRAQATLLAGWKLGLKTLRFNIAKQSVTCHISVPRGRDREKKKQPKLLNIHEI